MSDDTAHRIYWFLFRDNKIFWMASLFLLLMLIICYQALSRFTRYFNEVGDGVEQLLSENAGPIQLSPELEFMEKQLNTIRQTLEKGRLTRRRRSRERTIWWFIWLMISRRR